MQYGQWHKRGGNLYFLDPLALTNRCLLRNRVSNYRRVVSKQNQINIPKREKTTTLQTIIKITHWGNDLKQPK